MSAAVAAPTSKGIEAVELNLAVERDEHAYGTPQIRFEAPDLLPGVPLRIPQRGGIVWVQDKVRNVWFPHALDGLPLDATRKLASGWSPGQLGSSAREELLRIGILDVPRITGELRAHWKRMLAGAQLDLDRLGYAVIPSLLPPHIVAGAGAYYRECIANGSMRFGDEQALRFSAHRDPLAEWLHGRVDAAFEPIFADRFKRSYSFVSAYVGGAALMRHTDRPQCAITVSLCVDASEGAERWPLLLESEAQRAVIEFRMAIGHAIAFKGHQLPHSRNALDNGARYTSLLFHFADIGFNESLD